jgi:hypothetical protein
MSKVRKDQPLAGSGKSQVAVGQAHAGIDFWLQFKKKARND